MSDNQNLPPLQEGQDLTAEQGFEVPDNYDLKHAAFYAHIYGPHDELLGSAIFDKGSLVQFDPGVEHEFDGMYVKMRYGATAPETPAPTLDINLYPGWEIEAPLTTVPSYNNGTNLTFLLSGVGTVDWTAEYDGEDVLIPGSVIEFTWGDGSGFASKQYEISTRTVARYESANGLNYPYLTVTEDTFQPLTDGFQIGIREQGWVNSADGYIVVEITVRQTDDLTKSATGTFRVNKLGIDASPEVAMVFTVDTSLDTPIDLPS